MVDGRVLSPRAETGPEFAPAAVEVTPLSGGGQILRSPRPLEPFEAHLGEMLRRQATARGEATFLAERASTHEPAGWRRVSWAEALHAAEAIGQSLLLRELGPQRPVVILSGNSVDHALLMLGAFLAGVPVAPVSPAYSLMSRDFGKLHQVFAQVQPGLVFVERLAPFAPALEALAQARRLDDVGLVVGGEGTGEATPLSALRATPPGPELAVAEAAVGPETVAKILFTSGSTGSPKGVLNTHRMLCANQQMITQCWPFLKGSPPVLVDWLPWNHTFGANHNFNMVLRHGGTLYVDGGKPRPDLIGETVRNLREISPTLYFNVPAGFAQLVPHLERDAALRENFFRRLQLIFYAGAALPQDLWQRLETLALDTLGRPIAMVSAWGSTETSPLATSVHFPIARAGIIGLPAPGVEIKMVPTGDRLELRVKGLSVTPGYLGDPEMTAAAFDEDGFYKIGDAGRLADPERPEQGLVFDGRVAENFKLASGTWVHAGEVRVKALAAAAPVLQDAAVTGHDREEIGLLAWPNLTACRQLCGHDDADLETLLRHPEIHHRLREGLARHNAENPATSTRIGRLLLLAEPPDIDAGEITDKGYVNQRAVLDRRAREVERLYGEDGDVIRLGRSGR